MELSETDQYILDAIRKWVWSGFYTAEEVVAFIDDILEDDANEQLLRDAVAPEFTRKRQAEPGWPAVTDCDRLDQVFRELDHCGILCVHNAGYTMSDGHQDAFAALSEAPAGKYAGYCFYHGQDVERAVDDGCLMIAFDHVKGDVPDKLRIGLMVKEKLEHVGFALDWSERADQRICIPNFDWKRRHSG